MNLRECSVCCWGEHILQLLPGMFCTCLWCPFGLACNLIPMFFCCICLLLLKEGHKSLQLLLCWSLSLRVSWYLLYIFTCICFICWGLGIVLLNWSFCHYFVSSYWFRLHYIICNGGVNIPVFFWTQLVWNIFVAELYSIPKADFKLITTFPVSFTKCWNYRYKPQHLATFTFKFTSWSFFYIT